jgi:nitrogen-specific signal transduction histidine kinase
MDSVRTLVKTLRHEIHNPLGAILGGAFLIQGAEQASDQQRQTASLVTQSGQRIKNVLDQLSSAVSLEQVSKGGQTVYHVPGDKPWDNSTKD